MPFAPVEFAIDGVKYRVGKSLNVFDTSHVVRKFGGPLALLASINTPPKPEKGAKPPAKAWEPPTPAQQATGLLASTAGLDDGDVDWVIGACMSCVEKFDAAHWHPMRSASGAWMYEAEMDLIPMWEMIWSVLMVHKLDKVFRAAPANTDETDGKPA